MKYSIVVLGAPYSSQSPLSALRFAEAVVVAGHEVTRVFFYHDGVFTASSLVASPQDEIDVCDAWRRFGREHQVELIACIASCLRRGILDDTEATRYEKPAANLSEGFVISGLGQLVDAAINADRVVTFGA